ncbi:MAG TPA: NADH-quinone oxidoreductase subunit N [Mycobacteriales bacterium]|jgi:NADH-quinone oxidoreductase subunit N|nr:NADH-quinone oxidoreductase subunit N [Mycobacteriales bacterium]
MRLIQSIDYAAISPPVIVASTGVVVLVADLFVGRAARRAVAFVLSLVGTLMALGAAAWLARTSSRHTLCLPDGCSYVADDFAMFFQLLFLSVLVVVLLLSVAGVVQDRMPPGEYHALLLWSVSGMLVLSAARDLLSLLVALEVVSLPAFVLVGLRRDDARSAEAALKFFLFSVVSTALTAYGIALLYGATGHITLSGIADALARQHAHPGAMSAMAAAAVVLVVVGFAFKVSAVPFHFWTPDTYEGAPVAIAAFLSVASKAAGFAGLLILLLQGFRGYADVWGPVVAVIAAVTMTVGNLVALRQWHLVRLLAWSTVAQAGYLLMPLGVAATAGGRSDHELHLAAQATLTYLAVYAAMNLGAFACVAAIGRRFPRLAIDDVRGLARSSPLVAGAFALFLTALAGLPPGVAGLFAKVVVLRAAVHGHVTWLAVVAAVNTVIGLAYYLRVAAVMFSDADGATVTATVDEVASRRRHVTTSAGIALAAAITVLLSVYPQPILDWASHAATLAVAR